MAGRAGEGARQDMTGVSLLRLTRETCTALNWIQVCIGVDALNFVMFHEFNQH